MKLHLLYRGWRIKLYFEFIINYNICDTRFLSKVPNGQIIASNFNEIIQYIRMRKVY